MVDAKQSVYRKVNVAAVRNRRNRWVKKRCTEDLLFKSKCALRRLVTHSLKRIGRNKSANTETLLGCSWQEAKEHFEGLFVEGMSWANHGRGPGKWHIDHIRPVCDWKEHELHLMNHITNLQPLWEEDNFKKGSKLPSSHKYNA